MIFERKPATRTLLIILPKPVRADRWQEGTAKGTVWNGSGFHLKRLSVIVPVHGAPELLAACLSALQQSSQLPDEVIVVDDGSPEDSAPRIAEIAKEAGARLIRQPQAGPGAARNYGAKEASGAVLLFVDADVNVHVETLGQIVAAFDSDVDLAAVFGSYDDRPLAGTIVSDYRNLLHHFVHQNSRRHAHTFWAGCGAIRREAFFAAGGFDASFGRPSIEDVELGLRLSAQGRRIELRPEIQCTHAKRWTLRSFFLTDLFERAMPWTEMLFTRQAALPADLNFGLAQRLSVPLAVLLLISLILTARLPLLAGTASAVCIGLLAMLNRPFLGFLARLRGLQFALAAFPMHVLHLLASGLGFALGCLRIWHRLDPKIWIAASLLATVILGWQLASGTYQADFGGHPDEPGHYVTGVMVSEYLQNPTFNPMHFAEQYYLHYPKVCIGHWPPFFYLVQGLWYVCFGVSRAAALGLEMLLSFMLALGVYALARRYASFSAALGSALMLVVTLPFQASLDLVMAESCTAVLVLAATVAFARYLEQPGLMASQAFGVCAALALLAKGSACPLILLPLMSIGIARRFEVLKRVDFWLAALPVLILAVPWYVFAKGFASPNQTSLRLMEGTWGPWMDYGIPLLLLSLAGSLLLPKRDPYIASLAGLVLAFGLAPLGVNAFQESRHLLPAAGAAAVLMVGCWSRLNRPGLAVALSLALSWWLTPRFVVYPDEKFRSWAQTVNLAGPILVSGSATEEGAVVTALVERQPNPKQSILRASRVLANSTWNGTRYQMLVQDEAQTRALLEEHGITMLLQSVSAKARHDELLAKATKSWPRRDYDGYVVALNPHPAQGRSLSIEQRRLGRKIILDP